MPEHSITVGGMTFQHIGFSTHPNVPHINISPTENGGWKLISFGVDANFKAKRLLWQRDGTWRDEYTAERNNTVTHPEEVSFAWWELLTRCPVCWRRSTTSLFRRSQSSLHSRAPRRTRDS